MCHSFKNIFLTICLVTSASLLAGEPLIVAHRGASGQAPENTLPAFQLAWEQRADVIEGDFQLTKDGHIVCVHDRDTKRVSGEKMVVKDSTLAELQRLDVGSFKAAEFKGTRIPTIAEVLASIPEGKKIFIEVKSGREIVPQLLKDIKKSKLSNDQLVIICFDSDVLLEIRSRVPELKVSWLVNFKKDKEGNISPDMGVAFKILEVLKADGISTSKRFVGEEFIKRAQSLGYEHHIWTIDDIPTARQYRQWGSQSITTNFPAKMREAMMPIKKEKLAP
ncbi:MAG: glycerophosphoryl diester phosphodiesterase [Rubritalea sp.]|jgi:glycerophosphoryl diester phosphodiesterase